MLSQIEKSIGEITYLTKKLPEEAFKTISINQKESVPFLMDALEKAINEADNLEDNYQLHFYALFLLAQFQYKPAFPVIIRMISLSEESLDNLIGDAVTESIKHILYCTYDGDFDLLKNYIIYADCSNYAKSAALNTCAQLYLDGIIKKDDMVSLFKTIIYDGVIKNDYDLDTAMMGCICKCHFVDMLTDIRYLYKQERIDESWYGEYDSCIDMIFNYYERNERICYKINNAADELRNWAMFEEAESKIGDKLYNQFINNIKKEIAPQEKTIKVYPNDPCPCGSRKKYKKCCMHKKEEKQQSQAFSEDRAKWLEGYPAKADKRVDKRIYLEDYYDEESIEIDKLVYLALRHRVGYTRETDEAMDKRQMFYLKEAFDKLRDKCNKESIESHEAYDSKYMIHYESKMWMKTLVSLLMKYSLLEEYKNVGEFFVKI